MVASSRWGEGCFPGAEMWGLRGRSPKIVPRISLDEKEFFNYFLSLWREKVSLFRKDFLGMGRIFFFVFSSSLIIVFPG